METHLGITPARAGNTSLIPQRVLPDRNYPRSRGEYLMTVAGRGTNQGITPARAGNTGSLASTAATLRNYPHSRGEYYFLALFLALHVGITPARAGNTSIFCGVRYAPWELPPLARGIHPVIGGF